MKINYDEIKNLNSNIQEYINLGINLGFFNESNIERVINRLKRVKFVIDNDCLGDAQTYPLRKKDDPSLSDGIVIAINENKLKNSDKYYFKDEVVFHELTHAISGIYEDWFETLNGYRNTPQRIARYSSFDITNEDQKHFRQIGYSWGMIDEFVAQYMSQKFVEFKYNKNIYEQQNKILTLTEPVLSYESSLADYHEYEEIAKLFIEYYSNTLDIDKFCMESLDANIVENIINELSTRKNGGYELYRLLGLMGNLSFAISCRNFTDAQKNTDFDFEARDPKKLYSSIIEIKNYLESEIKKRKLPSGNFM